MVLAAMIQRGRFFWTGITRKGNEEGCGLLRSDLFILSLNLIGVAQRVPYIAHRIVRSDNGDPVWLLYEEIQRYLCVTPRISNISLVE